MQIALYCMAVKEKNGKLPVKVGHMYVHPHIADLKLIDISANDVFNVLENVKEAVKGILYEDFELKEQPNCYHCDYISICERL